MTASTAGTRVARAWRAFTSSLLFIPTLMTLGGILLFVATGALDRRLWEDAAGTDTLFTDAPLGFLVFGGTADAAASVLSTVAGSWATILGVAYSVTLVTVQLSATKYSAQVIPAFERDRFNQLVLGSFAMTVVYSFLVLKTVRSPSESQDIEGFVPLVGVNVSIVLAIASLLLFIWFVANLASYIRPARFVEDMTRKGIGALDGMREPVGVDGYDPLGGDAREETVRDVARVHHRASTSGYLMGVDWARLRDGLHSYAEAPARIPRRVRVLRGLGGKVHEGDKLLVLEGEGLRDEDADELEGTFRFTSVRTASDDPLYVASSLGDMAITALSGGSTDVGVTKDCLESILRLATADLARPPVRERFTVRVRGEPVEVVREGTAAHAACFVEASGVLDKSVRLGFWDVGETLVDTLEPLLLAAADAEDPSRWRDTIEWLEPALAHLLSFDDVGARERMLRRIRDARRALAEDGHDAEAAEVARALRRAAAEARLAPEIADRFAEVRGAGAPGGHGERRESSRQPL